MIIINKKLYVLRPINFKEKHLFLSLLIGNFFPFNSVLKYKMTGWFEY